MAFSARALIPLITVAITTGCATTGEISPHNTDSLSGTGRARITSASENNHRLFKGMDQRIFITSLDNKSLFRFGGLSNFPEGMLVSPGEHRISVLYGYLNLSANAQLSFNAESEKSYIIKKRINGNYVGFWIEDVATGQRVDVSSGAEPSSAHE